LSAEALCEGGNEQNVFTLGLKELSDKLAPY
jgi:hypothetical protein